MAGRPTSESKNHLRAWREYRRLTQAQLAEAVDTTGNVISQLESGVRGLSDKWLRRLAPALGTTPGLLLDHEPNDETAELLEIFGLVPKEQRRQAMDVLATFRKRA